ncbi:MAG: ACP phosphodiesterase [Verrucomicrobiota bacterium]
MNFLAHLHLAEPTPESCLGSLLGDFVKGYPWDDRFPPAVWQGIVEHRAVDRFTDTHPEWQKSRDCLPKHLRRYAGIVVDVYYDYCLHAHWAQFSTEESIEQFTERIHGLLRDSLYLAPPEARVAIEMMIREEWLAGYRTVDGVHRTLRRVSLRSPTMLPLSEASFALESRVEELEDHFLGFYPDLIHYMELLRSESA